jgi:antitoxin HicB
MTVTMRVDPFVLHYPVEIRPELTADGNVVYMAEIPELPGCMSHGVTIDEARQNLEDAKREYLAALEERHLPIPPPSPLRVVGAIAWTVVEAGAGAREVGTPSEIAVRTRTEVLEPA